MVLGGWYWDIVEFALSSASVLAVKGSFATYGMGYKILRSHPPTNPMSRYMIAMNMTFFNTESSAGCYR
jgi:hypothetical protein